MRLPCHQPPLAGPPRLEGSGRFSPNPGPQGLSFTTALSWFLNLDHPGVCHISFSSSLSLWWGRGALLYSNSLPVGPQGKQQLFRGNWARVQQEEEGGEG